MKTNFLNIDLLLLFHKNNSLIEYTNTALNCHQILNQYKSIILDEYHENQNRNEFLDTLFECYSESPHFEIESTFGNLNTIFLTKYLEFTRNERNLKAHSLTVALVKQFKKLTKSLFSCLFVSYIQKTIENFTKFTVNHIVLNF